MAESGERATLTRLVRESVLTLCREYMASRRCLYVDGIVCISLSDDIDDEECKDSPIVVKIHERLSMKRVCPPPVFLDNHRHHGYRPSEPAGEERCTSGARHSQQELSDRSHKAYDLSTKRTRIDDKSALAPNSESCLEMDEGRPEERQFDESVDKGDLPMPLLSPRNTLSDCSPLSTTSGEDTSDSMRRIHDYASDVEPSARWPDPSVTTMRSGQRRGGMPCRKCNVLLPDMLALERHNLHVHSIFTCHVCTSTFTARNNLKRHARVHLGVKPFQCGTCSAAFARKDDLKTHELRHVYSKTEFRRNQGFRCPLCVYVGSGPLVLRKHLLTHAREQFTCPPCGMTFTDPFVYTTHIKRHSQDLNFRHYLCCFCPEKLPTYHLFVKHEKTHAHNGERAQDLTHVCPLCNKYFLSSSNLREHLSMHAHDEGECPRQGQQDVDPKRQAKDVEYKTQQLKAGDDQEAGVGTPGQYWCQECKFGFQDEARFSQHIADMHEPASRRMQDEKKGLEVHEDSKEMDIAVGDVLKSANDTEQHYGLEHSEGNFKTSEATHCPSTDCGKSELPSANDVNSVDQSTVATPRHETSRGNNSSSVDMTVGQLGHHGEEMLKSLSIHQDVVRTHHDVGSTGASSVDSYVSPTIPSQRLSPLRVVPLLILPDADVSTKEIPKAHVSGTLNGKFDMSKHVIQLTKPKDFIIDTGDCNLTVPNGDTRHPSLLTSSRSGVCAEVVMSEGEDKDRISPGKEAIRRSQANNFLQLDNHSTALDRLKCDGHLTRTLCIKQEPLYDMDPEQMDQPQLSPELPTDLTVRRSLSMSPRKLHDSVRSPGFEKVVTPPVLYRARSRVDCNECGQQFRGFADLEAHSARQHRRYLCEYCGKAFTAKPNRDRHVRYHTGERPYRCPLCPQAFFRGDDLKYHRTTKHAQVSSSAITSPLTLSGSAPPALGPVSPQHSGSIAWPIDREWIVQSGRSASN